MTLGDKLLSLRKKAGLSQEGAAQQIEVSRQTISKWETNKTMPELNKAKLLCKLYNTTYEYLINDNETSQNDYSSKDIDWTKAWAKKYPILNEYQDIEEISKYSTEIAQIYDDFQTEFGFSNQDTVLILKDILYKKFQDNSK